MVRPERLYDPLNSGREEGRMAFLRSAWYMAAWSDEVGHALTSRTILKEPVLLYRREDGTPVAIADLCPHRFVPLSLGRLRGDIVECGYHGLRFDGRGRCVINPHGNRAIPPELRVRSYPVADRDGSLWIWMGDPETADTGKIPNFTFFDRRDNGVRTVCNYIYANFAYDILIDNLMDLSHAEFLHEGSFSSGYAEKNKMVVTEEGDTVRVKRDLFEIPIPPPFAPIYDAQGRTVDQWQDYRWQAPGVIEFELGVVRTGEPREAGRRFRFTQYATPETETTTHYFASTTREVKLDSEHDAFFREQQRRVLTTEDGAMLEAQQRCMGDREFWSMKPVLLQTDVPAVKVRRVMDRLIKAERVEAD